MHRLDSCFVGLYSPWNEAFRAAPEPLRNLHPHLQTTLAFSVQIYIQHPHIVTMFNSSASDREGRNGGGGPGSGVESLWAVRSQKVALA